MLLKSKIYLPILIVCGLILTGCGKNNDSQSVKQEPSSTNINSAQEITNAFMSGAPVICTVVDNENNVAEYMIKNNKMKATGNNIGSENGRGTMINDGEWIYIWEDGSSEGIKIKMLSEEQAQDIADQADQFMADLPDFNDDETIQEFEEEGYTVNCSPQDINDGVFTPPSNIVFIDLANQMQDMFSNINQNMPDASDLKLPAGFGSED